MATFLPLLLLPVLFLALPAHGASLALGHQLSVPYYITSNRSCCYGQDTYEHGEIIRSMAMSCLQLVCHDGEVVPDYFQGYWDSWWGQGYKTGCCVFQDRMYRWGERLSTYCVELMCTNSTWQFLGLLEDCCGRCTVYDDPHLITYDGQRYDWHGTCNYSLTQPDRSYNPDFAVYSDFAGCNGLASCIRYTTFKDNPNTVIGIDALNIFNLVVNGETKSVASLGVHQLETSGGLHPVLAFRDGACVWIIGSSRIVVRQCRHRLDILAHPVHYDQLYGLCGRYNSYTRDDQTSRDGVAHRPARFPLAFPLSWQTADQSCEPCRMPCPEPLQSCEGEVMNHTCESEYYMDKYGSSMYNYYYWSWYRDYCYFYYFDWYLTHQEYEEYISTCAFDMCVLHQNGQGDQGIWTWSVTFDEIMCQGQAFDTNFQAQDQPFCYFCGEYMYGSPGLDRKLKSSNMVMRPEEKHASVVKVMKDHQDEEEDREEEEQVVEKKQWGAGRSKKHH